MMTRNSFLKRLLVASGMLLAGGMVYAYQSGMIEISRERIELDRQIDPLRVVALSDIHAPSFREFVPNLLDLLNAEYPDVLILAGDIIDDRGNEEFVRIFKAVNVRFAKIATLGNWEYQGRVDLEKLKKEYEESGIILLRNASIEKAGLIILGFDDFDRGSPDYGILGSLSANSGPVLIVSHCPAIFDVLPSYAHYPVIVLSGHTHGGQIAPFGVALVTPRGSGPYLQGWYHKGKHSMYVMRGVGTSGIPLRIGARPEMLVLDIEGTKPLSGG